MNGILSNPKTKEAILNDIASKSNGDVAEKYELTTGRISQIKKANQGVVDQKKQELLAKLPSVVETVTKDLNTNKQLSNDLHNNLDSLTIENKLQLKTILDRTSVNILKIAGIFPSNTIRFGDDNSQHITVVSPAFQQYLDFQSNNPDNIQAIDTKGDNVDDGE